MKKLINEEKAITLVALVIIIVVLALVTATIILVAYQTTKTKTKNENTHEIEQQEVGQQPIKKTEGLTAVPTMNDKITSDSSWCGTFQLVWNDMKNEVVKQDVEFNPQQEEVKNLNKEDFNTSMLSKDYYFKIYGLKSLELKKQIEKGIKEKFNQKSDILDDFDWSDKGLDDPNNPNVKRYFFYTMLYRKFEYLKEFDKLPNGKFANKYNNINYFGIKDSTDEKVRDQIEVLYYNSKNDFALLINTKTKDEVIFCKNPEGNTFNEIYENMNKKADEYTGSKTFKDIDEFKAPNLEFNEKREYDELENKPFLTKDGDTAVIDKAIQTIKFSLDEKGGEIKSEAAIDMKVTNMAIGPMPEDEPRYFYVDDTFAIFLREKGKIMPYFAGRIEDITKFQ